MNDFIERYLYAVTKGLKEQQKADVAQELKTLIEDMLEERCGGNPPTEEDIRNVLKELGTPAELHAKYNGDSDKSLIGPPYYTMYTFVLKLVMICTAFGMTVAKVVDFVTTATSGGAAVWYEEIIQWFGMLAGGLAAAFAYVTLLFAFLYKKNIKLEKDFDPADLPEVPQKKELIPKSEPIIQIIFIVLFFCLFLGTPQIFCVILRQSGERIPIFDVAAIRNAWYLIALFAGLGLVREIVKLLEGRYTRKLMTVTIAVDVCSTIAAFLWLMPGNLMNSYFIERLGIIFAEEEGILIQMFSYFPYFFLGVIIFALVLDVLSVIFRCQANKTV